MSEGEKEAIESVKSMFGNITIEKLIKDKDFNITIYSLGILDILRVIAIVDKQQEEIEEYKKFKKDIVSKIMIWEKEELPNNERIIEMIDTLISEVSRLEDIEDKKIEVAIDFIEAKRDKFWQDKIRKTIEHYNNELEHIKNGEEFENEKPMYYWGKAALEGLLEEN